MREHKGHLYIGGIFNNRIGRLKLEGADPAWTGPTVLLGAHVIGALARTLDNVLGRGEAAVTVPPLDGALRPNRMLDEARRLPLAEVDSIARRLESPDGVAGKEVYVLEHGAWRSFRGYEADVACLSPVEDSGLAIALATGDIVIDGGRFDGRQISRRRGCSLHKCDCGVGGGSLRRKRLRDEWRRELAVGSAAAKRVWKHLANRHREWQEHAAGGWTRLRGWADRPMPRGSSTRKPGSTASSG